MVTVVRFPFRRSLVKPWDSQGFIPAGGTWPVIAVEAMSVLMRAQFVPELTLGVLNYRECVVRLTAERLEKVANLATVPAFLCHKVKHTFLTRIDAWKRHKVFHDVQVPVAARFE